MCYLKKNGSAVTTDNINYDIFFLKGFYFYEKILFFFKFLENIFFLFIADNRETLCGFSNPPHDECYRLLWKMVGCKVNSFTPSDYWRSMSLSDAYDIMENILKSVTIQVNSTNFWDFRKKCFGYTSYSDFNAAFERPSYIIVVDELLNHKYHVNDGIKSPVISEGGCTTSSIGRGVITVYLKNIMRLGKIIIWTPYTSTNNSLFQIFKKCIIVYHYIQIFKMLP